MNCGLISAARRRSAAAVTDPNFANVSFLHGWETPSTTIGWQTEESSAHRAGTESNSSFISPVTGPKFGSLCLARAAIGNIQYANAAAFQFGSGAFTIETWVSFNTNPTTGNHGILGLWDTGLNQKSWGLGVLNGALVLFVSSNGSTTTSKITFAWSMSAHTWYHIAADFDGTTYRLYIDGTMVGSATGVVSLFASTSPFAVGTLLSSGADNSSFNGWLDETRITKGVARYASGSGFTVPSAAFPRS